MMPVATATVPTNSSSLQCFPNEKACISTPRVSSASETGPSNRAATVKAQMHQIMASATTRARNLRVEDPRIFWRFTLRMRSGVSAT